MKKLVKINEKRCCVESFCHSPRYALAVLTGRGKGGGGGGGGELRGEDLYVSITFRVR